jgi:hypothetical protein
MQKLLRQIAIRGGLSALFLLAIGFLLTEVAARSFFAPDPTRAANDPAVAATRGIDAMWGKMRTTIPISMAIWGFVIVSVLELLRHFLTRGEKPAAALPPPPPDETEKLLEELLTQAESKVAHSREKAASAPVQPSDAK